MIQADYTVHNPHRTIGSTRAIVNGDEMTVMVDTFEVQLKADDLSDGSITLRFIGAEIAGAEALFKNDAKILVQFASLAETQEATAKP